MRIIQNTPQTYVQYRHTDCKNANVCTNPVCHETRPAYSYPAIYFTSNFNPQKYTPSKINIESEKSKMLKQFDDILKNDVSEEEMTKEELHLQALTRATAFENWKIRKKEELDFQTRLLWDKIDRMNDRNINAQTLMNERNALLREYNKLDKMKMLPPKPVKKQNPQDARLDFALINKFKSAVADDNFDLRQVYMEHYSGLNDIKSIRELKKRYPKIEIPANPKEVVSKKLEGCLTRDFYEGLDEVNKTGDKEKCKQFIEDKVQSLMKESLKKSTPEQQKEIYRKVIPSATTYISRRYKHLKENDSISSVPVARKIKQPIISDIDRKLLTVDYNDFVLHVTREQYLGMKKPNDISYNYVKGKSGQRKEHTLKVSELKNSDYKFTKVPEVIKGIINLGDELKFTQRNYDYFSKEDFINRLDFHADRQESNEEFLDILINFSTCRFEGEDIDMVKKFLREADDALDGKKTIQDVVTYIDRNNISPRGTEKLNEIERQNRIRTIKTEQKNHAKLIHLQRSFDENINLMYSNSMAYSAEMCSGYRPVSLDSEQIKKAEIINKITEKYINPDNNQELLNKDRMAKEITRWKKYNEYTENNIDKSMLEKAEKYAKTEDGVIDYDNAGKYLINYEAVNTYPTSFEYATNRDAAECIMKSFENDKDKAVEYLCKYDDYLDLSDKEKTKISKILKIFDKKSELDKKLLEPIIKNEYVKTSTTDWAKMSESGSKKVLATIAPNAKQGVLDFYGFPTCLNYFDWFEHALPQFATTFGTAGIKKLDKDFYELKIMGHTDRLIARNNEYIFNEFDDTGLH